VLRHAQHERLNILLKRRTPVRVDLVEVGVLRRGAVRGLEDGVAGIIVDVAARGDADASSANRHGHEVQANDTS
jgi:hypothetical protein